MCVSYYKKHARSLFEKGQLQRIDLYGFIKARHAEKGKRIADFRNVDHGSSDLPRYRNPSGWLRKVGMVAGRLGIVGRLTERILGAVAIAAALAINPSEPSAEICGSSEY